MKLKTLVKLNMVKENRPELILHVYNHEYQMKVYDYIFYKDTKVDNWVYTPGDAFEEDKTDEETTDQASSQRINFIIVCDNDTF